MTPRPGSPHGCEVAEPLPRGLTAEQFLAWGESQDGKFELHDGQVVAMAPERIAHGDLKGEIFARCREAIRDGGLPCRAFVDSVGVQVDPGTVFIPDVVIRCGGPLSPDLRLLPDAVVLVEVLSASTEATDLGAKLDGYFRIPSVRHYVVADADRKLLFHHERQSGDLILTRIVRNGTLTLDPPGIAIRDLFET